MTPIWCNQNDSEPYVRTRSGLQGRGRIPPILAFLPLYWRLHPEKRGRFTDGTRLSAVQWRHLSSRYVCRGAYSKFSTTKKIKFKISIFFKRRQGHNLLNAFQVPMSRIPAVTRWCSYLPLDASWVCVRSPHCRLPLLYRARATGRPVSLTTWRHVPLRRSAPFGTRCRSRP